jgi:electron transfer flavoprotein beta subunit
MMNIVVCVKQVPDPKGAIQINKDGTHIDTHDLVSMTNPCDLTAIKWATNQKDKNKAGEVTVVSLGQPSVEKTLRECFAYGADRALLLHDTCFEDSDGYATGVILSKAIGLLQYDIVLCGIQATDTNAGWVGTVVASKLGIPLVSRVIDIQINNEEKKVVVQRRLDGINREIVEVDTPCLLSVDPLLDEPRYPSIKSIRMAQRREIEKYDRASLGLSLEEVGSAGSKTHITKLSAIKPRPRRLFTPDSSLPAAERLSLTMSGGMTEKEGNLLEGSPADIIPDLIHFLRQEKIIH